MEHDTAHSGDLANVHLPATVDNSPMALIRTAIERGVDPDKMTALYNLAERWEANQAAKAFAEALTRFQAKMPPIVKTREVHKSEQKGGGKMYNFAPFEDVMHIAKPILEECGIVVTFTTTPAGEGGLTTVTCKIRVGTHAEETAVTLGMPGILNANPSQQAGGALSYGKRYAMCAALNIVITGEDKDGADQFEGISDGQAEELNNLLEQCRAKFGKAGYDAPAWERWLDKLWNWLKCPERMNSLRAADFIKCKEHLQMILTKPIEPKGAKP